MTKFNKEEWAEKRAGLEREKLDTTKIIRNYEGNFRPFRDVTDSEYGAAKTRLWQIATEISEGDYEANKPENPLDDMTQEQLQAKYDRLKTELLGDEQGRLAQSLDRDKLAQFNAIGIRLNNLKETGN